MLRSKGRPRMQIVAAAALYFAIVFGVGFLLGPIRVLWLEPWVGRTVATLCEAPILLIAMILAAAWVTKWVRLSTNLTSLVLMGVGALALQQFADFVVGISLRGIAPAQQLAYFLTPAGLIYAALLILFAAMPVMATWCRVGAARFHDRS